MAASTRRGSTRFRSISLSTRLALSFLLVGIGPLVVSGWLVQRQVVEGSVQSAGDRLEDVAITEGQFLEQLMVERTADVEQLALAQDWLWQAKHQSMVDDFIDGQKVFDLVLLVSPSGTVSVVNGTGAEGQALDGAGLVGRDLSDATWFEAVADGAGTVIGEPQRSPLTAELYGEERFGLSVSTPVVSSGILQGYLHGVLSFERAIGRQLEAGTETFRRQGIASVEIELIDHTGLVLVDEDPAAISTVNLIDQGQQVGVAATGPAGTSGSLVDDGAVDGVEQVLGYAVTDLGWGVIARAETSELLTVSREIRRLTILVGLVMSGLVLLIGWWVARGLVGPLRRNVAQLSSVAGGDLTVRLESRSNDELGRMANALNAALAGIGSTLAQVDQTALDLADSASDLTGLSREMSSTAEATADQVREVATTAEDISLTSETVARAMDQMSASVREISDNTAEAARVSAQAVDVTVSTRERMQALENSAIDIGNVVNVISSIAEQTDLLALNATIEAARVGEAGKGFAVVANEVKALASQTSSATDEIQSRVEAIQRDAVEAVQAIADISALIVKVSEASTTIAGAVEEQSATTQEVTVSLQAVTSGTADISRSIASVAGAAGTATDGARRAQESATHLSHLAASLNEVLARFELPEQVAASSGAEPDGPIDAPPALSPAPVIAPPIAPARSLPVRPALPSPVTSPSPAPSAATSAPDPGPRAASDVTTPHALAFGDDARPDPPSRQAPPATSVPSTPSVRPTSTSTWTPSSTSSPTPTSTPTSTSTSSPSSESSAAVTPPAPSSGGGRLEELGDDLFNSGWR